MSPKFITHLTFIFLISDLEGTREGSVCLYVSAPLTSPEAITEMKNLEERMKNTVSTVIQIAGQHLPLQFGGINWTLNVLVTTAAKTLGEKKQKQNKNLVFSKLPMYYISL